MPQYPLVIHDTDGTSRVVKLQMTEVRHTPETEKRYFLLNAKIAVGLSDLKQDPRAEMPDNLEYILVNPVFQLGLLCADGNLDLQLEKNKKSGSVTARMRIQLSQEFEQPLRSLSLVVGAGSKNISFTRCRIEKGEKWVLTWRGDAALQQLKRLKEACHAPETRMRWEWVEKHEEIDWLLKFEDVPTNISHAEKVVKWKEIQYEVRRRHST